MPADDYFLMPFFINFILPHIYHLKSHSYLKYAESHAASLTLCDLSDYMSLCWILQTE